MNIKQVRNILEQERGKLNLLNTQIKRDKISLRQNKKKLLISEKAGIVIRTVAEQTQKLIEFHISELVTMALKSVFSNPYTFHSEFIQKRGKTECCFSFKRNGYKINPLLEAGGGVIDIAAFALRVAMWSLSNPKWRNTLIFDEPFKNINDKTRETHKKIAEMVKMLSEKLKIQFIIVTMIPELEKIADKTYEVGLKGKVTKILNIGK